MARNLRDCSLMLLLSLLPFLAWAGTCASYTSRAHHIVICSDPDRDSRTSEHKWESRCLTGEISLRGQNASLNWRNGRNFSTAISHKGLGMELSDIAKFNGKIYACDDKTGIIYRLHKRGAEPWVYIANGDGETDDPFKTEWLTLKDGFLYAGSIGIEFIHENGSVAHEHLKWIKRISADGGITHINWINNYDKLRTKLSIKYPGFISHEAVRWSDIHKKWFILPRQISETFQAPYKRDNMKGSNIMFVVGGDDFDDIQVRTIGTKDLRHGFSCLSFVPGTHDTVFFALKSFEERGKPLESYYMIATIDGRVLVDETPVPVNDKFEGCLFVDRSDLDIFEDGKQHF